MTTTILHLSDIHFADGENIVRGRVRSIAEAVAEFLRGAELCVVACSGDIAYSGRQEEYLEALAFFTDLDDALKPLASGCQVRYAFVAGNHDCDFRDAQSVRQVLLSALKTDRTKINSADIRALCTDVQREFATFQSTLTEPQHLTVHDPLYSEYSFATAYSTLRLRCFNTAWMSQISEKPGELLFPTSVVPAPHPADVVVSVLHHPYNWFHPDEYRSFRKVVEFGADIVLTGHEHQSGAFSRATSGGETHQYIEGAVLQERTDPESSGFNVLVLDTARRSQKTLHFAYSEDHYRPTSSTHDWQPFQLTAVRARERFALDELFSDQLQDVGLNLSVAGSRTLRFSDLFVFPDLREVNYSKKNRPIVSGTRLVNRVVEDKTTLITGTDKSGKSALAKGLFLALHQQGYVPLLLRCGLESASGADDAGRLCERLYLEQYQEKDYERYRQLAPEKKAFILDDMHLWGFPRAKKLAFLEQLKAAADVVSVLSNDFASQLDDIVYSSESVTANLDFHPYRIQEFGHLLRDVLLDKWFIIVANTASVADEDLARRVASAKKIIATIVGRNFVPSYPVFILAILQAQEANTPVELSASTYGYFYDLFVRGSLAKGSREFDLDTKLAYLSRLARHFFDQKRFSITESELRRFHEEFESHINVRLPFSRLVDDLVRTDVIAATADGSRFRFKYPYIYYYFAATNFRDTLQEPSTRSVIVEMSGRLWVEEYANILLFLAHMSRDPFIIDTMVARAKELYSECAPAQLDADVDFVNELFPEDDGISYIDAEPGALRRRLLGSLDTLEPSEELESDADPAREEVDVEKDLLDPVLRLNMSLKTIQILGQILKNFTALGGNVKLEVAEECYMLGLRTLSGIYDMMRSNRQAVIDSVFHILRKEHPKAADDDLEERARGALFELAELCAYGIVKRVSHAVGSEKLMMTYDLLSERIPTPAVKLIDTSVRLDNASAIPETQIVGLKKQLFKNPLGLALLKQMVVHHFYLFDVHFVTKQRLCDRLGIPYKKFQVTDSRQKLVK